MKSVFDITYRIARRIAVLVIGGTVLLVGIAMIVGPGPAIVVIPLGLTILGIEFAWARYWLRRLRVVISNQSAANRAARVEGYRRLQGRGH